MPRRLHLLPWETPLLTQAVDWLLREAEKNNGDLSGAKIVLSSREACRRFAAALARNTGKVSGFLLPNFCMSEEVFSAALDRSRVATPILAQLAWSRVLMEIDPKDFRSVLPIDPPERTSAWAARLAKNLLEVQAMLSEGGLTMSDVASKNETGFGELERWRQLGELERRQSLLLAREGLLGPEAAKIASAKTPPAPPKNLCRVVLIAVADPLPLLLPVLDAWSANGVAVDVLVFGESLEDFDEWGRPLDAHWPHGAIKLTDFQQHVHVCLDADAQARWIENRLSSATSLPLALACVDSELRPEIAVAASRVGTVLYLPEGKPLCQHGAHYLLRLLRALEIDGSFEAVEKLARCPDVYNWLGAKLGDGFSLDIFLSGLLELRSRHLPTTLAEAITRSRSEAFQKKYPLLLAALSALESLRETLTAQFPDGWLRALEEIWGETPAHGEIAEMLQSGIREWAESGARLDRKISWIDVALAALGEARFFPTKTAEHVDLDGWLELLWRDEPHLVVLGFNDHVLPGSIGGHAFLPESLRVRLGLKTNTRRWACDAWQLSAIAASRRKNGKLEIVLGRFSRSGEPRRPSRLLMQCSEAELPHRVRFLLEEPPATRAPIPWAQAWKLSLPAAPPVRSLSVTAFRDYLACPLRFYLGRVLEMQEAPLGKRELDASDFGNMLHRVLERIGDDPEWRDAVDAAKLSSAMLAALDEIAVAQFGKNPPLSVVAQLESARQRLSRAAHVQAAERAAGWVVMHTEWVFPKELPTIGGLKISGRIDRVERNEHTGAIRVLDYKTSDAGNGPVEMHTQSIAKSNQRNKWTAQACVLPEIFKAQRAWADLQLPLYRWAGAKFFRTAEIEIGYFLLPKAASETRVAIWEDYSEALQESALRCADAVARAVAAGNFWPPSEQNIEDKFSSLFPRDVAGSISADVARRLEVSP